MKNRNRLQARISIASDLAANLDAGAASEIKHAARSTMNETAATRHRRVFGDLALVAVEPVDNVVWLTFESDTEPA